MCDIQTVSSHFIATATHHGKPAKYTAASPYLPSTKRTKLHTTPMSESLSSATEHRPFRMAKCILEKAESWTVEGKEYLLEADKGDERQCHIEHLEKQASRLRHQLLIKRNAPLINENWYGDIAAKYRITFIDPAVLPISLRLTELNRFILDDVLPSGQRPSGLKAIFTDTSILREERLRKTFVLEVCLSARLIVHNQYFEDGNHRTAILMMYEMLADIDLVLDCTPMALYILLSNRKEQSEDENTDALYKMAWKHHHKSNEPLSPEYRAEKALAVKDIQYMNTQVENAFTVLRQEDRQAGRLKLRSLKRTDRFLYNCLTELKDMQFWS